MAVSKKYILGEIKRTAEENGGKALGSRKFATVTGIKPHDWRSIHWAKWSDALSEAGFGTNEFVRGYGDEELLEKFAQMALELGKIPTTSEMGLRARSDPHFPHAKPFRRFGGKTSLVERVREFANSHPEYSAVATMCEEYLRTQAPQDTTESDTESNVEFGSVYLMKSGRLHKIGRANAAGRREYELALQTPEKTELVHVIQTDDPVGIEAYWHSRFKDKRHRNEWFKLGAADVAAFRRRKFM